MRLFLSLQFRNKSVCTKCKKLLQQQVLTLQLKSTLEYQWFTNHFKNQIKTINKTSHYLSILTIVAKTIKLKSNIF